MTEFKPNYVGYARVSSKQQHLARQIKALTNHGVNPKNIYHEKVSGATIAKRPEIQKLLKDINKTNVVVVASLDRLGRNAKDIKNIIKTIKSKGATLEVVDLPSFKDVKNKNLRALLDDLIIDIYSYQAEAERKNIRERQAQGIAVAKSNHKYHGRKPKFTLNNPVVKEAIKQYLNRRTNKLSATQIARMNGMSRKTLYRRINEYKQK